MKNDLAITRREKQQTTYSGLAIGYLRCFAETLLHGFSFRTPRSSALRMSATSSNPKP
jgi:hypothetical protein